MKEPDTGLGVTNAMHQLRVGETSERLEAARFLVKHATASDIDSLRVIRRRELDQYVVGAIDEALKEARSRPAPAEEPKGDSADDALEEQPWDNGTYARALRATTTSLVHELRRPMGLALAAGNHGNLDKVVLYLERMDRLLDAMEKLVRVAEGGAQTEFELRELITEIGAEQAEAHDVSVEIVCDEPVPVTGDRGAVELIVKNGIVNACESTNQLDDTRPRQVVVSCGKTDRNAWISVLDNGVGLPTGIDPFGFAKSRKEGHDGIGLALARQAAHSLGGTVALSERQGGGAVLQLSWPLKAE